MALVGPRIEELPDEEETQPFHLSDVYSPKRYEADVKYKTNFDIPTDIKYEGDPHGPRKLRGRKAADNLFQIAGSKYKRDIVRRNNFMPGQFQLWNKNPKGGNNKYYGSMEDYDNDKIPHEFVVRRGGRNGPVVAWIHN